MRANNIVNNLSSNVKTWLIVGWTATVVGACEQIDDLKPNTGLSNEEVVAGLKEALKVGTDTSVKRLHKTDAYFKNELIKILLPPEAQNLKAEVEELARNPLYAIPAQLVLDKANQLELQLNRAAENAAVKAKPIFWNAIRNITIADGMAILNGDSVAATRYLQQNTQNQLIEAYRPPVDSALTESGAKPTWADVVSGYNALTNKNVETDLTVYTTSKALDGLFYVVGQEEARIRRDPIARVTDILRKVFGSKDK
jgi:hypothetical protein